MRAPEPLVMVMHPIEANEQLSAARMACPACGHMLAPWGSRAAGPCGAPSTSDRGEPGAAAGQYTTHQVADSIVEANLSSQ